MRVAKLPNLGAFNDFSAIGPDGTHRTNINGRGAAIEAYLELDESAVIRWTAYNNSLGTYQGELLNKERYAKTFLRQRKLKADYDYSNLEAVLDVLINEAIAIKGGSRSPPFHPQF